MEIDFKNFLEETPLLTKVKVKEPVKTPDLKIDHIECFCDVCKKIRAFHNHEV